VRLWDVETGVQTGEVEGNREDVSSIAFCPLGKHLLTGGQDRLGRGIDIERGETGQNYPGSRGPPSPRGHPPGSRRGAARRAGRESPRVGYRPLADSHFARRATARRAHLPNLPNISALRDAADWTEGTDFGAIVRPRGEREVALANAPNQFRYPFFELLSECG